MALQSRDRLSVLARVGRARPAGIRAREVHVVRRSRRSSGSSRTSGCAADRCGAGCRRRYADRPIFVFETGGTTGVPKSRINIDDFRIDYEWFSATLPDEFFPKGSNWLHVGPSGPRRLRLAVEHLAQYRGGICFMVDLDPRWVIKLINKGWSEHLQAYKDHVIDQAVTHPRRRPRHQVPVHDAEAARSARAQARTMGTTIRKAGITGIFSGGTEFTPQWNRFAHEELLDGAYMTPTYGNTLMGLAPSEPQRPAQRLQDHLSRPAAARGRGGRRLRRSDTRRRVRRDRDA